MVFLLACSSTVLANGQSVPRSSDWQAAALLAGEVKPLMLLERQNGVPVTFVPLQRLETGIQETEIAEGKLDLTLQNQEEIASLLLNLGILPPAKVPTPLGVSLEAPYRKLGATNDVSTQWLENLVRGGSFTPKNGAQYFVIREVLSAVQISLRVPLSSLSPSERSDWSLMLAAAYAKSGEITVKSEPDAFRVEIKFASPRTIFFNAEQVTFPMAIAGGTKANILTGSKIEPKSFPRRTPTLKETGRAFLFPGNKESPDGGLYSYVLLHSPPNNAAQRNQYLAIMKEFLRISPADILAKEGLMPKVLNTLYLPLREGPPQNSLNPKWLVDNYDYDKAKVLLSKYSCRKGTAQNGDLDQSSCGPWLNGPYLLSTWKPLSTEEELPESAIFQDWTSLPPDVIGPWMEAFQGMVVRGDQQVGLSLRVRTVLSRFTAGLDQLRSAAPSIASLAIDLGKLTKDGIRLIGLVWTDKK
jgi:hypothetical protein